MRIAIVCCVMLLARVAVASVWYASPTGSGDGSLANPWPISTALTTGNGQSAGDTIYLRGGTYIVSGLRSTISGASNNYITVRSYPGEWAHITDGLLGVLGSDLPNNGNNAANVVITNSETWASDVYLAIASEQFRSLAKTGPNVWTLQRAINGTSFAAHPQGSSVVPVMEIISQTGSYVSFQGFEISSVWSTNRVRGTTNFYGGGLELITGVGNKAVNLIIHDTGHPAIGFWNQGAGGEVNGCLIWGTGQYQPPGLTPAGSAVYSQNNAEGLAKIKNTIAFRNFTTGGKVYSENYPVKDFQFIGNIAFQNPTTSLESGSGATDGSTSNLWYIGNTLLGYPRIAVNNLTNVQMHFVYNKVVNGGFILPEHTDSEILSNTVFFAQSRGSADIVGYSSFHILTNNITGVNWDYNTYYIGEPPWNYMWTFRSAEGVAHNAVGGGLLRFDNDSGWAWKNWAPSGWDANSTVTLGWPSDYLSVEVQSLDYDTNRWHIAVVNTTAATSTTLNLSSQCGFTSGQRYQLRDAQQTIAILMVLILSTFR